MDIPGIQQAPVGQKYQLLPNFLLGVISAGHPNPGGWSITHYKRAMGFPANRADVGVYKQWRRLVKHQLVARNFTLLANFAIGKLPQIVAGIRGLHPACDQLATESAANDIARLWGANKAIFPLVKNCICKLTTTINK